MITQLTTNFASQNRKRRVCPKENTVFKKLNFRDLKKIFFSKNFGKIASDHFFQMELPQIIYHILEKWQKVVIPADQFFC